MEVNHGNPHRIGATEVVTVVQGRVDARVRAARDGKVMPEDDIPERAGDSGGERGLARARFIATPLYVDTFNVADRRPCSAREHAR